MKNHSPDRTTIFLVDDHPLVRKGLVLMLEQGGFAVAGEADSIQATLDHPGLGTANVVLLDISLEQASGMCLIPALRLRGVRVVIYSMHEEPGVVQRALAAGAMGYVTKREAAHSLADAIRAVVSGGNYISSRAAAALARLPNDPDFSPQQQLLYDFLGRGCDVGEIASSLHVSPRTVETYCVRLMDKLGVDGMKELRRRAIASRQQPSD